MKTERIVDTDYKCYSRCISWTAIFAGALVGVGLSFLLNLFSFAIGVSAFASNPDGSNALAIGGLIALIISTIVAMFFAGMTAGGIAGTYEVTNTNTPKSCHLGSLYGFTTWTVTLIMSVLLAMHMGHFVDYTTARLANPNAPMVVVVNDLPSSAATTSTAMPSDSSQTTTVSADKAAHGFATAAFVAFILFLIGAMSAVVGAHWGLCCCKRKCGTM